VTVLAGAFALMLAILAALPVLVARFAS